MRNRKLTVGDAVRVARSHGIAHQEDDSDALLSSGSARLAPAEHPMFGYGLTPLAGKPPRSGTLSLLSLDAVARKMYETKHPGHTPWPHCGWDVRRVWLSHATQENENAGPLRTRLPFWREIKSWLWPSEHNGA